MGFYFSLRSVSNNSYYLQTRSAPGPYCKAFLLFRLRFIGFRTQPAFYSSHYAQSPGVLTDCPLPSPYCGFHQYLLSKPKLEGVGLG